MKTTPIAWFRLTTLTSILFATIVQATEKPNNYPKFKKRAGAAATPAADAPSTPKQNKEKAKAANRGDTEKAQ